MKFTPGDIKNETDLMLLTFDDTVWDQVYDKGLSCQAVRRLFALSLPLRALCGSPTSRHGVMLRLGWVFVVCVCMCAFF
jgi:hypothetical protein